MKKLGSTAFMIILLILLSLAVYSVQLFQFHDPRDTAFYFLQDMAFLPLQVAIVSVVLGKVIGNREKKERLEKINMIIGAFFSETGTDLMRFLIRLDQNAAECSRILQIRESWTKKEFDRASASVGNYSAKISCSAEDLLGMKVMLTEKRYFVLRLLENPNLLEHERVTDMLWAILHLTDELSSREDILSLPATDVRHLEADVKRAYQASVLLWTNYMYHLKTNYPYLFSLELRKNPFSGENEVIVR